MLAKVLLFAKEKHKNQTRIGGEQYITHPIAVQEILKNKDITDIDYLSIALLHDILEDTDTTDEEILDLTNQKILYITKILTKTDDSDTEEYIKQISKNKIAKTIKLADRLHNLNSAMNAYDSFKQKYIKETENHYLDLAKDTIFEKDIKISLQKLKASISEELLEKPK